MTKYKNSSRGLRILLILQPNSKCNVILSYTKCPITNNYENQMSRLAQLPSPYTFSPCKMAHGSSCISPSVVTVSVSRGHPLKTFHAFLLVWASSSSAPCPNFSKDNNPIELQRPSGLRLCPANLRRRLGEVPTPEVNDELLGAADPELQQHQRPMFCKYSVE